MYRLCRPTGNNTMAGMIHSPGLHGSRRLGPNLPGIQMIREYAYHYTYKTVLD